MGDITPTRSVPQNPLTSRSHSEIPACAEDRPAVGKRMGADKYASFFAASALEGRASAIALLLDRVSIGVETLRAAVTAIESITRLVERARSTATGLHELPEQIDALAGGASRDGVNLLDGDDLSVVFNENPTSRLDIAGVDFTAAGLGLESLAMIGDLGRDDDALDEVLASVESALSSLLAQSSWFASQLSVVETRQTFLRDLVNVLKTGATKLTLECRDDEGANLTELQTRQRLHTSSRSLAAQADQNVLQLIRG
jgi:flagellin-like hook-associated protein FlgL